MYLFLILGTMDYTGVGGVMLEIQPGQTSVTHDVTIINDDVTEVSQETFVLNLQTSQPRVSNTSGFDQALVTITDEDSKLHENNSEYE